MWERSDKISLAALVVSAVALAWPIALQFHTERDARPHLELRHFSVTKYDDHREPTLQVFVYNNSTVPASFGKIGVHFGDIPTTFGAVDEPCWPHETGIAAVGEDKNPTTIVPHELRPFSLSVYPGSLKRPEFLTAVAQHRVWVSLIFGNRDLYRLAYDDMNENRSGIDLLKSGEY